MELIKKNRNVFIDTLKGILIVLVVIGHSPSISSFTSILISFIYCFHMPAFFVLSSLNIKTKFSEEVKKIKQIFIVYIFWLTVTSFKNNFSFLDSLIFSNWEHLRNILWFLPALMTYKLIFSLCSNKYFKYLFFLLGVFTILFSNEINLYLGSIPWGLNVVFYMAPCTIILKDLYPKIDFIKKYSKISLIIFLTTFFLGFLYIFYFIESHSNQILGNHYLDFAQFVVPTKAGYFCLSIMMFIIVTMTKIRIKSNFLAYIGRNTMPIYLFHYFFITILTKLILINNNYKWALLIVLVIILCLLISYVLKSLSTNFKYLGA